MSFYCGPALDGSQCFQMFSLARVGPVPHRQAPILLLRTSGFQCRLFPPGQRGRVQVLGPSGCGPGHAGMRNHRFYPQNCTGNTGTRLPGSRGLEEAQIISEENTVSSGADGDRGQSQPYKGAERGSDSSDDLLN